MAKRTAPSPLPVLDLSESDDARSWAALLDRLRATVIPDPQSQQQVEAIVRDVIDRGDEAIVAQMRQWVDPDFDASALWVDGQTLRQASDHVDGALLAAIDQAIDNVRTYQRHILPQASAPIELAGAQLGMRYTPMDSAGLLVPGGSAPLFSTLIMLAGPALEAGISADNLAIAHPPPTRHEGEPARDISPIVLATAHRLGITRFYRMGGPAAVGALAFGSASVQRVDMIAGPGHPVVQQAKRLVAGKVGVDGFYGASEIVSLIDGTARPDRIASDLLAQAEHDPGKCFLLAWDASVIEAVLEEVTQQLPQRSRRRAIEHALRDESAALLCRDLDHAIEVANTIAPEHMNLAVKDPDVVLQRIRHAGEVFLSDSTPVAAGDYFAGPSHTLPTGTTARFTSGVSVHTFLKRTGTVRYPEPAMPAEVIDAIACMARAEGLDAHAASVHSRRT